MVKDEPGPIRTCFWQGGLWDLKELREALVDALVMGNRKISHQVWAEPSEGIVRPGGGATE